MNGNVAFFFLELLGDVFNYLDNISKSTCYIKNKSINKIKHTDVITKITWIHIFHYLKDRRWCDDEKLTEIAKQKQKHDNFDAYAKRSVVE